MLITIHKKLVIIKIKAKSIYANEMRHIRAESSTRTKMQRKPAGLAEKRNRHSPPTITRTLTALAHAPKPKKNTFCYLSKIHSNNINSLPKL